MFLNDHQTVGNRLPNDYTDKVPFVDLRKSLSIIVVGFCARKMIIDGRLIRLSERFCRPEVLDVTSTTTDNHRRLP